MRRRPLHLAAILTAAAVLLAYLGRWVAMDRIQILRSDYLALHDGLSIWTRLGSSQVYDFATQLQTHAAAGGDRVGTLPFINPPPALLLLTPLRWLQPTTGYWFWTGLQLFCLIIAAAVALGSVQGRRPIHLVGVMLVGLAGSGVFQTLVEGQWTGMLALGLAVGVRLLGRGRYFWGGFLLALTFACLKPHLALGLAALLGGWRHRRVLAGATAGVAAAIGLALMVGPASISSWISLLGQSTSRSDQDYLGVNGLLASLLGPNSIARPLALGISLLAIAICLGVGDRLRRGTVSLSLATAVALCLSLMLAPHLWLHDLGLLVPAFIWLAAPLWTSAVARWPGRELGSLLAGWVVLNLCGFLDTADLPLSHSIKWTPLALALGAWLLWRYRRNLDIPSDRTRSGAPVQSALPATG